MPTYSQSRPFSAACFLHGLLIPFLLPDKIFLLNSSILLQEMNGNGAGTALVIEQGYYSETLRSH